MALVSMTRCTRRRWRRVEKTLQARPLGRTATAGREVWGGNRRTVLVQPNRMLDRGRRRGSAHDEGILDPRDEIQTCVLARASDPGAESPDGQRRAISKMVYSNTTLTWCSLPAPPSTSQAPLFSPCVAVGILMPIPAALFLIGLLLDGAYVSTRHCCRRARSVSLEVSGSVNAPLNPLTEPPLADAPTQRLLQRLGTVVSVLLMACTVVTVAVCAVLPPELPAAYLLAPVLDFAAAAACCVILWRCGGSPLAWRQRGLAGLYGLVDAAACVLIVFQLPPPDSPAQDARSAYFWLAVARGVLAAALALAMLWPKGAVLVVVWAHSGHVGPGALGAALGASERSGPGGGREEDGPPMMRRISSAELRRHRHQQAELRRSSRNVWQE
jgi:hypothetical protein